MSKNTIPQDLEFEICVCCNKITKVPVDLHISKREHYVEGCGQLCPKCALTSYIKENTYGKRYW